MTSMAVPPADARGTDMAIPARPELEWAESEGADPNRGESDGTESDRTETPAARKVLNPQKLAYLMGPAALGALLVLTSFGMVAKEPIWLWLAVFAAIPVASLIADNRYDAHSTEVHLHARVAIQVAAVTTVIYLSGWGPVLAGAFAFLALENVARCGSRVWKITALWSLLGITAGQLAISLHVAPSFLTLAQTNALALMGAFILVFIIRMAGA